MKKLLSSEFKYEQEAIQSVKNLNKNLKYHQIDNIEYKITKSKNKTEQKTFYQVNASISENINAIKMAYNSAGRFIVMMKCFPNIKRSKVVRADLDLLKTRDGTLK